MRLVFLLAALSFSAQAALAWGCEGHQIIALLARAHLTPAVSAAVDDLLRALPIDPALNSSCKDHPDDPMAASASWVDDIRNQKKNGAWHYVDIPRTVTARTSTDPWCPPMGAGADGNRTGCVVNALRYFTTILRDKTLPTADRATALRYVIHFVGDIHQPLHDIDNYDQGGNCTTIRVAGDDRASNLHSIWDTRLIQKEMETAHLDRPAFIASLDSRFAAKYASLANTPANDPESWAWEANAIARNVAYGNLEPGIPVAQNGEVACPAEREKVQALHIVIGDSYTQSALPAVDEQLATAGFRLAGLLNATL